ncbi:MAG: phosphogluconate dehydrogenase (NAD(+)-dependent, decarboxylating) [Dehalococcoidia bacterium]
MELGMVGLGRMGGNMAQRLLNGGHKVVAYDPKEEAVQAIAKEGALGVPSIADLSARLTPPRAVWVMVPSGQATESTVNAVAEALSPGDVIIDGGNSYYKDSMRRAASLAEKDLVFLDAGTSGGVWGLKEGYSLMVGGDPDTFRRLEPIFQTLAPAPDKGYGHVGPAGAGHFVKMIHNGIEYGLMEAYAEGFDILQAKKEFNLDVKKVGEIWQYGSVVRSWLLDLVVEALKKDPDLSEITGYVADSGEGRWTVAEAIDLDVPAPIITLSLTRRLRSRVKDPFAERLLAALRQQFGGHAVRKSE